MRKERNTNRRNLSRREFLQGAGAIVGAMAFQEALGKVRTVEGMTQLLAGERNNETEEETVYIDGVPMISVDYITPYSRYDYDSPEWKTKKENLPSEVDWRDNAPNVASSAIVKVSLSLDNDPSSHVDSGTVAGCELIRTELVRIKGETRFKDGVIDDPNYNDSAVNVFNPSFVSAIRETSYGSTVNRCIETAINTGICTNDIRPNHWDTYLRDSYWPAYPNDEQIADAGKHRIKDGILLRGPLVHHNYNTYEDLLTFISLRPVVFPFPTFEDERWYDGNELRQFFNAKIYGMHEVLLLGYDEKGVIGREVLGPDFPLPGGNGEIRINNEYFRYLEQSYYYTNLYGMYIPSIPDNRRKTFIPSVINRYPPTSSTE